MTGEDFATTESMNARAEQGEYILQYERPTSRKALAAMVAVLSSTISSNILPRRAALLQKLGMDAATVSMLTNHVSKIHQASLEAEAGLTQLLKARNDYQARLKVMLPDLVYDQYVEYEKGEAARREFERFDNYVWEQAKEFPFSNDAAAAVERLFADVGAVTEPWWHGPFDILPEVAIGIEGVTAAIRSKVARAAPLWEKLFAAASSDPAMPPVLVAQRSSYFSDWVAHNDRLLRSIEDRARSSGRP